MTLPEKIANALGAAEMLNGSVMDAEKVIAKAVCPGCANDWPLEEQNGYTLRHVHEYEDGDRKNKSWTPCFARLSKIEHMR